jgi:hypothetical protein
MSALLNSRPPAGFVTAAMALERPDAPAGNAVDHSGDGDGSDERHDVLIFSPPHARATVPGHGALRPYGWEQAGAWITA